MDHGKKKKGWMDSDLFWMDGIRAVWWKVFISELTELPMWKVRFLTYQFQTISSTQSQTRWSSYKIIMYKYDSCSITKNILSSRTTSSLSQIYMHEHSCTTNLFPLIIFRTNHQLRTNQRVKFFFGQRFKFHS